MLDTSFNCFLLTLKAQPSYGVQVGLQMRQGAGEKTFCVQGTALCYGPSKGDTFA